MCQINGDFVISREIVQISQGTVVKWLLVSQILIIKFKE
jgi:predicted DNA repair protein MutK